MSNGYSRVQKFVREAAGKASLAEADDLQKRPVWLLFGPEAGARTSIIGQALAAIAVRTCTGPIEVRVVGDDLTLARIRKVVEVEAEAYGCLSRLNLAEFDPEEPLKAGICTGMTYPGFVTADASGMYAAVNRLLPPDWPVPHAAAACFAAASAYAKYFAAHVIGRDDAKDETWVFSLERLEPVGDDDLQDPTECAVINLGDVHLLGGGAIGSGFSYVAHLSSDDVELDIVDRDRYEEPNQETTFFLSHSAALRRQPKAQALAGSAARAGLRTTFQPQMEVVPGSPYLSARSNAFVCAVDNPETRRILDGTATDVLLNAGLGGTKLDAGHLLVSWHNTNSAPLSVLYPESADPDPKVEGDDAPTEITDDCSRVEYASASLAAPFIALAAGAVLFALARLSRLGQLPVANYLKIDLLGWQQSLSHRTINK